MGLNKVKQGSNMYQGWITHTWNTIKGACPHNCSYCYMKRWGELKPVRFDEKEMKTELVDPENGKQGISIFVGSSCDMFANNIPTEWIEKTLNKCSGYPKNTYLFQTKNPERFNYFPFRKNTILCTTIETNRYYPEMGNTTSPQNRALSMKYLAMMGYKTMLTIEPVMDFDLKEFVKIIKMCNAIQINIGADSGKNYLTEPSPDKIRALISELSNFTKVKEKSNLKRLLK